jgi:hypothetical protein
MVYAADRFLRNFLGITSVRNPGILNNRNHEDPTYPIFHIKFQFNPPEAKHPDYVTNRLLTDLENESSQVPPESAIKYLYNVGEPERAEMLKKFNISLKNISEGTPWFFQGISGLDNLYKHGYETEQRGDRSLQDVILTINTLDSIDYRITGLKDLYRKVAYDRKFRRWVLPVNMRRFRMSVMVGDYRQLAITEDNYSINGKQALSALRDIDLLNGSNIGGKLLGRVQDGALSFVKRLQWWDNHFSCIVFDCQDCEFDMNSFGTINTLDHSKIAVQNNAFKIKVGRVLETNTYSLLEYSLSDNLIENFLKSENKSQVITRSKNLSHVFKPKGRTWDNYQNLEREKGDNKRVILDDGGFSNALGAGINEGLNGLGFGISDALGNGTNLGEDGGFLGSVGDFFGDTASELAQEALSLATEQIASNVYGNELTRSIAGVGLGILNGDLNQVAQNFSNPALAGALGINVESSGRPVQPNLRDGVPSKLDLTAPSVQRSQSDIQANLTGQGSDPRFQSIGRPGESLFNNPNPSNRLFDQKNIDLQASRVETEMPDNVEFTEVRKETRLNPNKEQLTGATPKNKLDESSVNLEGAGKKTDLVPSSADLTGAQPLKDLVPSNADLNGAQPLKDLVPSNADLTGAQPLKDLIPSNADLNGADALKDLIPSNADLNGADALKDLIPSNADLNGAEVLKDLVPSNADLNGAEALKDLNPSNADLNGANALKDLNPSNIDLNGADALKDLNPSNADLNGSQPLRDLIPNNADLIGASTLKDLNSSNADLNGSQPLRDLVPNNANLQGAESIRNFSESSTELNGAQPIRDFNQTSADLNGTQPIRDFNQTSADLNGTQPIRDFTETSADLNGTQPIRDFTETSADLNGTQPIRDFNQTNADLIGTQPLRNLTQTNADLSGTQPLRNLTQTNADLLGATSLKDLTLTNVELGGSVNNRNISDLGKEDLLGKEPQRDLNPTNVNLIGKSPLKTMDSNVNFNTNRNQNRPTLDNANLEGKNSIKNLPTKNVNLTGNEPLNDTIDNIYSGQRSLGVIGNKNNTKQNRINLEAPITKNIITPKNLGGGFEG